LNEYKFCKLKPSFKRYKTPGLAIRLFWVPVCTRTLKKNNQSTVSNIYFVLIVQFWSFEYKNPSQNFMMLRPGILACVVTIFMFQAKHDVFLCVIVGEMC